MFKNYRYLFFLILITMVLLNSCSTTRKDGPPTFYVDESKIPNAVPKAEPLSRSGNQPYYTVFGKRYSVMRSSKDYEERGIASWYGTRFHAHHTSNGERYNMLAMTAAHKSLPLPTYVEVTNLKNGRQVIVKVNDRGPFEANRLIDLSYVAAKKLGMIGHGTTYVNVKAINPNEVLQHRDIVATKRASSYIHHANQPFMQYVYLQVGAFKTKGNAQRLKNHLATVITSPINIAKSKILYHVQIGPIKDIETAKHITKQLTTLGVHSKAYYV